MLLKSWWFLQSEQMLADGVGRFEGTWDTMPFEHSLLLLITPSHMVELLIQVFPALLDSSSSLPSSSCSSPPSLSLQPAWATNPGNHTAWEPPWCCQFLVGLTHPRPRSWLVQKRYRRLLVSDEGGGGYWSSSTDLCGSSFSTLGIWKNHLPSGRCLRPGCCWLLPSLRVSKCSCGLNFGILFIQKIGEAGMFCLFGHFNHIIYIPVPVCRFDDRGCQAPTTLSCGSLILRKVAAIAVETVKLFIFYCVWHTELDMSYQITTLMKLFSHFTH